MGGGGIGEREEEGRRRGDAKMRCIMMTGRSLMDGILHNLLSVNVYV